MKKYAIALISLLLFSLVAAASNYSAQYVVDGWFKVNRTVLVEESTNPCFRGPVNICAVLGGYGSPFASSQSKVTVSISVQNIGSVTRTNITFGESISFVPQGVKIQFLQQPEGSDGKIVYWKVLRLAPGESKTFSYQFEAEKIGEYFPPVSVVAEPIQISLSAPSVVSAGQIVNIALRSSLDEPVAGATVFVETADGTKRAIKTNAYGVASFVAESSGFYTYSVEGFRLRQPVSTKVLLQEEQSTPQVTAAAVGNKDFFSALAGIFPIVAAIFAIAVIALVLYNFVTSQKEEEQQPTQKQQEAPTPTYSQQISFGKEEEIAQTTRDILESRKRQLAEKSAHPPVMEEKGEVFEAKEEEVAQTQEEIDKAIAELEAIRQKLHEKVKEKKPTAPAPKHAHKKKK
ncbi:MAG: hypothetical protein QXT25_01175 [Candidatus Anstonellaceae archaeon]